MFKTFCHDFRDFLGICYEIVRVLFLKALGRYKAPKIRMKKGKQPIGHAIPTAFL